MTPDIKQRIEQTRRDELPERYKKTKAGIMPEEWEEKFIKDISSDIYAGATPETKVPEYWKNGTIPWLASGEIHKRRIYETEKSITEKGYQSSSTKMLPANCVLIALAGQGKTRGTVAVNKIPLCTNQSIAAIIPNNCYYQYLYYFLDIRYNNLREISSGDGTRGGLNLNLIANYPVTFPPLPEQHKIADILSTQDKVIELKEQLLAQKQQQKKYLMQQLLTGKKRLPGFSGQWKTVKLSEVVSERKQKNIQQNLRICSVAVQKGVVDQIEHLGRSYASSDTSNYSVAYYGDIIYTKSPTGNFPYGIVKQNLLQESIAVSPLYGVFSSMTFGLGYFLHTYFQSPVYARNYLLPIIQKGAKNTINITNETFISNNLYLPLDEREQNAIANIFITADREIDLLRQSIEAEKQKKKALMQLLLTGIVRVNV